ncbi:hypothetical protein F2Q68_00016287 [Brassica cretica]|uniref:Uncharacterized protein n=1 Tax=Brassica cretica TaxID=69181 RepID=A0A8S9HG57_BRACR|nr:hypothetical protein F2Q68_00016287 [Brassica cretica]
MREAEGRALTTQHTPLKSMEGELIRRSDIDALIKALKENGNDIGNTLGYSFAASYLDRTRVHLSSEIETKCSDSPDQRVIHDGDSSEVTDQNKGTQQPVPVKEEEEMQPDVEEVQSDVPRAASDPVVEVVARNEVCGDLGEVKSTRPYMVVQEAVRLGRTELDQRLAQLEREKQPYPHFTYVENIIGQF